MINWFEKYSELLEILEFHSKFLKRHLEKKFDNDDFRIGATHFIERVDEELINYGELKDGNYESY